LQIQFQLELVTTIEWQRVFCTFSLKYSFFA